jgi:hypothetical protein
LDYCVVNIFQMEKGCTETVIIQVFKISTMEMWTMHNKNELVQFIERETNGYVSSTMTIEQLMRYLPIENYCRVK